MVIIVDVMYMCTVTVCNVQYGYYSRCDVYVYSYCVTHTPYHTTYTILPQIMANVI